MKADGKLMESNKAILRHTWKVGNHLGFHPPPYPLYKHLHSEESSSPRQRAHSDFSKRNLMLDEEHVKLDDDVPAVPPAGTQANVPFPAPYAAFFDAAW